MLVAEGGFAPLIATNPQLSCQNCLGGFTGKWIIPLWQKNPNKIKEGKSQRKRNRKIKWKKKKEIKREGERRRKRKKKRERKSKRSKKMEKEKKKEFWFQTSFLSIFTGAPQRHLWWYNWRRDVPAWADAGCKRTRRSRYLGAASVALPQLWEYQHLISCPTLAQTTETSWKQSKPGKN